MGDPPDDARDRDAPPSCWERSGSGSSEIVSPTCASTSPGTLVDVAVLGARIDRLEERLPAPGFAPEGPPAVFGVGTHNSDVAGGVLLPDLDPFAQVRTRGAAGALDEPSGPHCLLRKATDPSARAPCAT